jgi:hypothetical protein
MLTPEEVRRIADAYGQQIFFTKDFHIGALGLDEKTIDRIYSAILEQIVQAWVAGYVTGSNDPQEAA